MPKARRWPLPLRLFRTALKGFWADSVPRLGASLSYYTLFAIAPVLLVVIAIAGFVFGPDAVRGRLVGEIDGLIGTAGAEAVQTLLQGASEPKASRLATVIGGITFLITASGAFLELQHALNTIWRVKPSAGARIREFLLERARSFGIVLALGFLLVVSLAASAALSAVSGWVEGRWPLHPAVWQGINMVLAVALVTVIFALVYRFLPDVELRWGDVWMGAFVTALLFNVGKYLIGLYLGTSAFASSYGAIGSVLVLLLWVYYTSQVVLLGAEFTRAYTRRSRRAVRPQSFAEHDPKAAAEGESRALPQRDPA